MTEGLDSLTLRALVRELQPLLEGAFLQKFSQLSDLDYRLIFRQPGAPGQRQLLLRLLPGQAGLTLTRPDGLQAVPPKGFTMLVRKLVQGRPLFGVRQLGLERIVELRFPKARLMIELLDRQPNVILVREEDDKVLGGHQLGRVGERFFRPGLPYVPPPRPELPDADVCPDPAWFEGLAASDGPLARELSARLFGLPSVGARALVAQAKLSPELPACEQNLGALAEVWSDFFEQLGREVTLGPDGRISIWGNPATGRRFASLLEAEASLSQAAAPEKLASSTVTKRALEQRLARARTRLERTRANVEGDLARVAEVEELQLTADLLIAHPDRNARGPRRIELTSWDGSRILEFDLDAGLTAREAAQKLFKRAAKYRRAAPVLQERLELLAAQLEQVQSWALALAEVKDPELLAGFSARLDDALGSGKARPVAAAAAPSGPRRYTLHGFSIMAGRNPRQNDLLLSRHASRDDLWLHARDYPGSHVLIKTAGRLAEPEVLEGAAVLAGRFSQGSRETRLTVICAEVRHVRKVSGGPAGKVIYEDELSLVIDPQAAVPGLVEL